MTPRRALITGASKGIGYVLAELLAAAGHRPVGLARTAPADYPGEFHPADLADRTTTAEVLDRVLARGPVDGRGQQRGTGATGKDRGGGLGRLGRRVRPDHSRRRAGHPGRAARNDRARLGPGLSTSPVRLLSANRSASPTVPPKPRWSSAPAPGAASWPPPGSPSTPSPPDPLRPRCSGRTTHTGRPARPAIWPASRSAGLANRTSRGAHRLPALRGRRLHHWPDAAGGRRRQHRGGLTCAVPSRSCPPFFLIEAVAP
jgi:hypothetical protein